MKTFQKIPLLVAALFALRLCADDTVKFSGTVVDAQGKPVADAAVDYYRFPNSRMTVTIPEPETKLHTTTDNAGAYAFSVKPGPAAVVAHKAGLAPAWRNFESTPAAPIEALTLTSPTTLAGVVVDEKGQPLPGAEVSVAMAMDKSPGVGFAIQPNVLFGKLGAELFSTRTSADGHFRIEGFPEGGQASLQVKSPGRALRPLEMSMNGFQLPVHSGQEDIKLVTDPAANIEGQVVVRESGAPLPGAQVQLLPDNNAGRFSGLPEPVYSGADGSFRFTGVAGGSYRVTVRFTNQPTPEWIAENVPVTAAAGETARGVKIQASKGGTVDVTVTDKTNKKGLSGVQVNAYGEGYQQAETTGADGTAHFRLPPGQFTFYAAQQGMSQVQEQATVTDGDTSRVTLEMTPPSKIAGIVRDPSGAPVANATVGVFPNYGGNQQGVKTDASGHYEVPWEKPQWAGMQNQTFYLFAQNVERNLAAVHELEDKTRNLDMDLKPGMSVSGRIQNAKGNPITNATVYVMLQMDNGGFSVDQQPIQVDQQGRFSERSLPLGQNYSLFVNAKGYGSANQSMESPDPKADHYDFPPTKLRLADRKLAGRVLGTDGKPVAGANVFMNGQGQPNGNATTDSDGRFSFDACDGNVFVQANSQGDNGSAQAMGGDTNVVIRFGANRPFMMNAVTVSGTVYDPSGNPAADVRVMITPAWGMADNTTTDEKGEYKLHWQNQGGPNMKFFVLARDPDRNLAGMEPISSKKTEASVHMQPGFSISGTVLDSKDSPLPQANVNLNIRTGNMYGPVDRRVAKVGQDGTFTISALPPGQQYIVNISANGYGSGQRTVTKMQSQSNSFQLAPFKLRTADHEIAGKVVDKDGKTLTSAYVYINGMNQPNASMQADSDGHFKFKVCSGPIYVSASTFGGGQNSWGQTQARGGDMNVVVKMGDNNQRGQALMRATPLIPQPWTLAALIAWPADHKSVAIALLAAQVVLLLGAAGAAFWMSRRRSG